MKAITNQERQPCPCQSNTQGGQPYSKCCQAIHQDITKAHTAEMLLRARYCAYVLHDEVFLINSWHPETRPGKLTFEPQLKWISLTVHTKKAGEINDVSGEIEFIARYKTNGKASRIHEISQFKRYKGYWVYLHGQLK